MRKIKVILLSLAGLVVLLIALFAIAVIVLDDEDYQRIVTAAVERYTGYTVIIEGGFDLDLSTEPSLSASNIRFEADADGSQPPITHIGHIHVKLAAQQLLIGIIWIRQLIVEDVTLLLTVGRDRQTDTLGQQSEDFEHKTALPVFESVSLRNINVDLSDIDKGHLFQAKLNDFKIEEDPDNALQYAEGDGMVDIYGFKIHGRLGTVEQMFDAAEPFPVELSFESHGVVFKVSGRIADLIKGEGYALHVLGEAADVSNFFKLFKVEFPGLGRLKFSTDIVGNVEELRASNIDITISEGSQVDFEAKGSVTDLANGKGLDVAIIGSSQSNDFIRMLLPDILSDFSNLELEGRLRDRRGDYVLEDIAAHGSNNEDLALNAEGMLNFGRFVDDPVVRELDLNLQVFSQKTKDAKRFLVEMLPELGPVTGKARLKGPIDRLSLEDVTITINESGPLEVRSQGRIEWIPIDDRPITGLDLALSAEAAQTQLMATAFDIPLPELGPISVNSRLFYSDNHLQIDKIDVRTLHADGLKVELYGKVGVNLDEAQESPGDVNVDILITAPNMGAAEPILGARVFSDLGPVRSETKVTGTTRMLSLENIAIAVGQPGSVSMEWRGRVGKVPLGHHEIISDVEVTGSMRAERTSELSSLIGFSVPDFGPLKGSWRAVDRKGVYGLDDVTFFVGDPEGFHVKAVGKIESVLRSGEISVKGIGFDLTAAAPDISNIPVLANLSLPDLGPLQMKAEMAGKDGRLGIRNCTLRTGDEENATLSLKGELLGFENPKKTVLNTTFETYTQPWVEKLMQRPVPGKHQLFGTAKLTGLKEQFHIQELKLVTKDTEQLSLQASGTVRDENGSLASNVQISASSKDPSVIGSILGFPLHFFNPVAVNGRLISKGEQVDFKGETHFGQTHFKTIVTHSTKNSNRPVIAIKNTTPTVYLSDLGIYPEEINDESATAKKPKAASDRLFNETQLTFDLLKSLNLSLSLDADKLIGRDFVLNNLDFDLILKDGLLRVSPARLCYAEGDFSFESTVDATGGKPEFMLRATCEDLDMDALLAHAHRPLILGGNLNLVVDLRSAGNSLHEIASSLNGEFGLAIENGKLKRNVERLTSDAIDMLTSLPKMKKYQDLNCLAMRFIIDQGIAQSEILFLDTPNVHIGGGAKVDLASETLDMVLQPKPKKGLPGARSAIRIQGPLSNPSMKKLPFREAARLYGEIFAPYVFLPARGLGYLWYVIKGDKGEESPCLNLEHQENGDQSDQ